MCPTGGEYADNGLDQLIIDGEAMPVLKEMIKGGKTPGVQEGAVRLLTRLCSTPEAREQVSDVYRNPKSDGRLHTTVQWTHPYLHS